MRERERESREIKQFARALAVAASQGSSVVAGYLRVLLVALVAVGSLGACVDPSAERVAGFRDPEIHPIIENAVPSDATLISDDSVPAGLGMNALDAWRSARDDLLAAQTVTRLGSEEEGPQLFGSIGDVAVDAEGSVFVFDVLAMELRVFDSTGRYLTGVGGFGDGPTELRYNLFGVFELLGEGRILVGNGARTKLFLRQGDMWQLERTVEAPGLVTDLCVIGDRAYFAGWRADDNSLVQTASVTTGAADAGFVQGYQHPDYLVRSKMAEGVRIACFATAQQAVVGWGHLPMVASYRAGQRSPDLASDPPIWTSRVSGRLPSRIVYGMSSDQTGVERPTIEDQTDPRDFLTSFLPMSSGHVLIQYSRAARGQLSDPLIRTYLVETATGRGALLGTDLPVISTVLPDGYVAVFSDPYPRLEVRRLPAQPAGTGE